MESFLVTVNFYWSMPERRTDENGAPAGLGAGGGLSTGASNRPPLSLSEA
jgi:hypothetical protein